MVDVAQGVSLHQLTKISFFFKLIADDPGERVFLDNFEITMVGKIDY